MAAAKKNRLNTIFLGLVFHGILRRYILEKAEQL
jgi:hypothetical protein